MSRKRKVFLVKTLIALGMAPFLPILCTHAFDSLRGWYISNGVAEQTANTCAAFMLVMAVVISYATIACIWIFDVSESKP